YTEQYPEKVSSLVLLNSTSESDSEERKKNRDRAIRLIKKDAKLFITLAIHNLFNENTKHLYAHEIKQLKEDAYLFPVEGIIATIKGMRDRKDRTDVLKTFSNLKYLVCGNEDTMIPKNTSRCVAENTNSELYFVNSGHMTVNENREEMIKILHFIDIL
ncbi:MAG: alpha/beta hydrolase, partial [Flavobacteriaceae bacterium]|nr:alpha/beta hydrolase [Flavobacteriaceae bacterium]